MKKIILTLVLIMITSSLASANVLMTANSLGAGKIGWLIDGKYDSNTQSTGNVTFTGVGGFLGYGLTEKLDIFGELGYGTYGNLPSGLSAREIMLGLAAKYQLVTESGDMPVSVAALLAFQPSTATLTLGSASGQAVQDDISLGAIVSKVTGPWAPYGALVYHSFTTNPGATTGTNLEIALGSQMHLSKASALVGEVSLNSISTGGTSFSDTQVSLGYTAKI